MPDRKALTDETPEDVATLYSWANLHGAKYRDFSASRAQTREKARQRVQEAIETNGGGPAKKRKPLRPRTHKTRPTSRSRPKPHASRNRQSKSRPSGPNINRRSRQPRSVPGRHPVRK